ncbi:GRB2-associated-binding protein 2 [Cricetulus griseus]|uniref:GRB2-associated-binding protein 2 n=1 Tax=Cricetulus griseus TaxID=10029 RepID=G3HHT9_CRIGR|nr:GRB2-associated-binding protein 2 [Cricetulus griseus]
MSTQVCCGLQAADNDVVCTGWQGKITSLEKVGVLCLEEMLVYPVGRQMSCDSDVLEYYKNQHSKKPLQIINLNFSSHTFNSSSSRYCSSISNTDSGDSEENYVPMQNPMSLSPVPSGTNNPAPQEYWQHKLHSPGLPAALHKTSTSSVTSDEKGEYVQVDKERTQALQKTLQE